MRAIRYVYRPYHPWRHGYRREKIRRAVVRAARILLLLECLWFVRSYIRTHTTEETRFWKQSEFAGTEGEFFGVGIEPEAGALFWFHSSTGPESGTEEAFSGEQPE